MLRARTTAGTVSYRWRFVLDGRSCRNRALAGRFLFLEVWSQEPIDDHETVAVDARPVRILLGLLSYLYRPVLVGLP